MIYLCSPYSHPDPKVVQERYEATVKYVNEFIKQGRAIISPVVYGHNIAQVCGSDSDWTYWGGFCEEMMGNCDEVLVLQLDGWLDSVGITAELQLAEKYSLPVTVVTFD